MCSQKLKKQSLLSPDQLKENTCFNIPEVLHLSLAVTAAYYYISVSVKQLYCISPVSTRFIRAGTPETCQTPDILRHCTGSLLEPPPPTSASVTGKI